MLPVQKRRTQAGEGKIGFVFSVIVLILAGMALAEFLPARWKVSQFEDHLVETAQAAARTKIPRLRKSVLYKAQELDIPLDDEHLEILVARGKIVLRADYVLTLDLPMYTYEWHVKHDVQRPLFSF
jgi:hypothetical protein